MKPTTVLGLALLGLALALVGLNAFMPTWPGLDGAPISMGPSPRATAQVPTAAQPLVAVAAPTATPIVVTIVHPPMNSHAARPQLEVRRNPVAGGRQGTNKAADSGTKPEPKPLPTHTPHIQPPQKRVDHVAPATPLPAPTLLPATPRPTSAPTPRKRSTPLAIQHHEVHPHRYPRVQRIVIAQLKAVRRTAVIINGPALAQMRNQAEIDTVRRTAMGVAKRTTPGTAIISADIDDLHNGRYRAVLVERNPHGTIVESMYFQPAPHGGSLLTERHVLSSSVSDPAVVDPSVNPQ